PHRTVSGGVDISLFTLTLYSYFRLPGCSAPIQEDVSMKKEKHSNIPRLFVWIAFLALAIIPVSPAVTAQMLSTSVDGLLGAAKNAAGLEWPGTLLRLCIQPPPDAPAPTAPGAARGGARGTPPGPPARETWYAEPAKVADNL